MTPAIKKTPKIVPGQNTGATANAITAPRGEYNASYSAENKTALSCVGGLVVRCYTIRLSARTTLEKALIQPALF